MTQTQDSWFLCELDRKTLKSLMKRDDRPALIHFGVYFALLIGCALGALFTWGTWWMAPFYLGLCFVWAFAASVVHESCHGTPFRTRWLNEAILAISGWMVQMEPISVRWVHAGHHSHTSIEEKDSELALANPISWPQFFFMLLGLAYCHRYIFEMVGFCFGYAKPVIRDVIPETEMTKVRWTSRAFVASYLAIIAWSVLAGSWMPVVLLLLPRFAGAPVYGVMRIAQHTGLAMNLQDHRQTTRTFYANPLIRFFYFNMNYHVEHHMFPLVPFYNLPKAHEVLKDQLPRPNSGFAEMYREILDAVHRQQTDKSYFIRKLPADASGVAMAA